MSLAGLQPPLILGTFHVGPFDAIGRVLESLAAEPFIFRREAEDSEERRALAFHLALRQLKRGGFVVIALDPAKDAARIDVPFLGQTLALARGAFALSRISGIPILPFVVRRRWLQVSAVAGERIETGDEQAQAAAAARWLEGYVRRFPEELTSHVRTLMRSRNA